jgi:hypothetical protein
LSKKEDDDFAAWQAKFVEGLDAEAAAAFQTLSTKAPDRVREDIYRGTLRQSDYNRAKNEAIEAQRRADALYAQNDAWYQNKALPEYQQALTAAEAAQRRADVLAAVVEQAGLMTGLTPQAAPQKEQVAVDSQAQQELQAIRAQLQGLNQGLPNFMRDFAKVSHEIVKGGYSVAPDTVLDYANQRNMTLSQAFSELTVDERKQRDEDAINKRIEAARAEERRSIMSQAGTPDFVRAGPRNNLVDEAAKLSTDLLDYNTSTGQTARRTAILSEIRNGLTS